jgi:hypothetical protein
MKSKILTSTFIFLTFVFAIEIPQAFGQGKYKNFMEYAQAMYDELYENNPQAYYSSTNYQSNDTERSHESTPHLKVKLLRDMDLLVEPYRMIYFTYYLDGGSTVCFIKDAKNQYFAYGESAPSGLVAGEDKSKNIPTFFYYGADNAYDKNAIIVETGSKEEEKIKKIMAIAAKWEKELPKPYDEKS